MFRSNCPPKSDAMQPRRLPETATWREHEFDEQRHRPIAVLWKGGLRHGLVQLVAESFDLVQQEVEIRAVNGRVADDQTKEIWQFAKRLIANHRASLLDHHGLDFRCHLINKDVLTIQTRWQNRQRIMKNSHDDCRSYVSYGIYFCRISAALSTIKGMIYYISTSNTHK